MHRTRELEAEARSALAAHAAVCGGAARARCGEIDFAKLVALLDDRRVVRYPTEIRFGAEALQPGEFAVALPKGADPRDGFVIHVHPRFEHRPDDLPSLVAYHLASVNYGEIATCEEAEAFGAALLGVEREAYYARLCALADELPC